MLQNILPGACGVDDEQGNGVLEITVRIPGQGNGEILTVSCCLCFQRSDRFLFFFSPKFVSQLHDWSNPVESCLFNTANYRTCSKKDVGHAFRMWKFLF